MNGDKWSFATTVCEINIIASSGRLIENTEVANEIVGTEMVNSAVISSSHGKWLIFLHHGRVTLSIPVYDIQYKLLITFRKPDT